MNMTHRIEKEEKAGSHSVTLSFILKSDKMKLQCKALVEALNKENILNTYIKIVRRMKESKQVELQEIRGSNV